MLSSLCYMYVKSVWSGAGMGSQWGPLFTLSFKWDIFPIEEPLLVFVPGHAMGYIHVRAKLHALLQSTAYALMRGVFLSVM